MNILEMIYKLKDQKYATFTAKLIPNISSSKIIGVQIPKLRKLAKEIIKNPDVLEFLSDLPHEYNEENLLHALIISEIKDFDKCIIELEKFLPYMDNWMVCDILSPKIFKKNKNNLLHYIKIWSSSKLEYVSRFGIGMLMEHFLDDDFNKEYLNIPISVNLDFYYTKMMIAWFFATSLAKQWNSAIVLLENNVLDVWVHNKTIQKAIESDRIPKKEKVYLKTLKR